MTELLTTEIVSEFDRRFFAIPFGNSDFQNRKFVMEAQYTPERAYRALGLRLADRLQALNEARFNLQRREVDIEELQEKLAGRILNKFERRRLEIDLAEKQSNANYTAKMVNDALVEVDTLWTEAQKFPEFTREQFESAEQQHFEIRLKRQVHGLTGAADSLDLITAHNGEFSKMLELTKTKLIGG